MANLSSLDGEVRRGPVCGFLTSLLEIQKSDPELAASIHEWAKRPVCSINPETGRKTESAAFVSAIFRKYGHRVSQQTCTYHRVALSDGVGRGCAHSVEGLDALFAGVAA